MLSIKHILAPVEFNDPCRAAGAFAFALASRMGAELTIVHVLEPSGGVTGLETSLKSEEVIRARACGELHQFLHDLTGPQLHRVLLHGDPASEMTKFARNNHVDLILMPTRGLGTFRRLLLGSVTAKVLHDAACPVWTGVHPEAVTPDGMFSIRRVGCAVDLGPQTRAALSWASEFAAAFRAELNVFHVLSPVSDDQWRARLKGLAEEQLNAMLQELAISGEFQVAFGSVPGMIPELVSGVGCDLAVIGRGHMSTGARLGGHAYGIIRDSVCPVVSV